MDSQSVLNGQAARPARYGQNNKQIARTKASYVYDLYAKHITIWRTNDPGVDKEATGTKSRPEFTELRRYKKATNEVKDTPTKVLIATRDGHGVMGGR